jgi:PIN domain nuclease of toxin-antitoxin system
MVSAVADTHTIVWYLFSDHRLSSNARDAIEGAAASGDQVAFSAITLAEIVYLAEKGRIQSTTYSRLIAAIGAQDAVLTVIAFDEAVAGYLHRVGRDQVPDMPDRIIAATALALGMPLISRDSKIRLSGVSTIW